MVFDAAPSGRPAFAGPGRAPSLIPRDVLFGNPVKAAPRISPDGAKLAYLAPSDEGVLNVWVRTIGRNDEVQVTADSHRGIRKHLWAEDSRSVLYLQDADGDENWRVYAVDVGAKKVRELTPFPGVRAEDIKLDKDHPDEVLVALNLRDRRVFDMHRVSLRTGEAALDAENPGDVLDWITDAEFRIRAAMAQSPVDGGAILRTRDSDGAPWRDIQTWPFGENGGAFAFTKDGRALYAESSLSSDTTRLVKLDAATGAELETLAEDPRCDLGEVVIHPDSRIVQAAAFSYLRREWRVLDPAIEADFATLARGRRGEFQLISRDRADRNWIVAYETDDGPVAWWAYSRDSKKADLLFVNRPELEQFQLARREPVVIPARDGMKLPSYLTLPPGADPHRLPLVLNVHGGPWGRDSWGFDPEAQWLANRGYAVLQVNFRGSTGFGKRFLNAGDVQWGVGRMQQDLTDAVEWAMGEGIADPQRIGIFGGSYGGYATLAGLAFTPELYACGVDIVGPSNLKTLLESIPPYWAPVKKQMVLRMGDVEQDEALNRRISPLFHVEKIKAPLLIGQGANDPRVNIRESTQMVDAVRARKLDVTYVVYPDEGHGFARPDNRLDFYGRAEEFLARTLGGRAEPWRKIEGSTAELR